MTIFCTVSEGAIICHKISIGDDKKEHRQHAFPYQDIKPGKHLITEEQIRLITILQLEKVKKTARGQVIELVFDDSLVSYLARVSYVPEFGARELRRKIQTEVETVLAKEMLKGNIKEGDKVALSYDENTKQVVLRKAEQRAAEHRVEHRET